MSLFCKWLQHHMLQLTLLPNFESVFTIFNRSEFGLILIYFYICDRTNILRDSTKVFVYCLLCFHLFLFWAAPWRIIIYQGDPHKGTLSSMTSSVFIFFFFLIFGFIVFTPFDVINALFYFFEIICIWIVSLLRFMSIKAYKLTIQKQRNRKGCYLLKCFTSFIVFTL